MSCPIMVKTVSSSRTRTALIGANRVQASSLFDDSSSNPPRFMPAQRTGALFKYSPQAKLTFEEQEPNLPTVYASSTPQQRIQPHK